MHPQARSCVDLDDHTALTLKRLRDVLGDNVDACDIQADDACSLDRMPSNIWMELIGNIARRSAGAQVRIATDKHFLANRRNRVWRHALIEQNT